MAIVSSSCSYNDSNPISQNEMQTNMIASWAYPFVKWEGRIYVITEEELREGVIGAEIGEVTSYSHRELVDTTGNFSNIFEVGTKYFDITDIDNKKAIAVKKQDGKLIKAIIDSMWEPEKVETSVD